LVDGPRPLSSREGHFININSKRDRFGPPINPLRGGRSGGLLPELIQLSLRLQW